MLERPPLYTGWTRAQDTLLVIGEREAVEYAAGVVKSRDRGTRLREFIERVAEEHSLRPARSAVPTPVASPAEISPPDSNPSSGAAVLAAPRPPAPGLPRLRRPTGLPPLERSTAAVR
jgi:hypothetical protein